MKILKKGALFLLALLLIIALSLFAYLQYSKPQYEGTQNLSLLQKETTVYFDEYGVPHIYANSQHDAMIALGYVHAQDRLWQMELMRRIAPGRLSELFGTKALKNDTFFAASGIDEYSEKAVTALDQNSESYKLASAYLQGINQYIEQGKTPIEFSLLGVPKSKFTLKDVYNIFGFMSFSFAMGQKTDPLLSDIRNEYGMDYLKDFGIDGSLGSKQLKSYKAKTDDYLAVSQSIAALLDNSPIPPFIGSNSWIIGAPKTKKGKVIFANDPHIGFSQPCTWYEAHICTPDYEMYGYYLAGTPFPLLGHNRNYAYGLTMFENDDMDLFEEEPNPANAEQYLTSNGYHNFSYTTRNIKVKDSATVRLKIKHTVHGPILNGALSGLNNHKPVALSWIYTQHKSHLLDAVFQLSHAPNVQSFYKGVSLIAAPGLNVMYADAKDNIAWITSGKLYKMPQGVNPNFILNGANGIDDKKEFLDFSKNPSAINPPWNYLYSANNQPEAIDGYLYPGYYLPKDRAMRIDTLLAPKSDWTAAEVQKMITDVTSATAPTLMAQWSAIINKQQLSAFEKKALTILQQWNGGNELHAIAPTIYNKWIYCYLQNTFKDELGAEKFDALLSTHIVKQLIASQSNNPQSPWWDNCNTKGIVENQSTIMTLAYKEAIESLREQLGSNINQWTWNRVHTLEHQHPFGKIKALKSFFNVGPFDVNGSNEVINNLLFSYTDNGQYEVKAGPSTRRVIDFSNIENSYSILPTGQSGNPMSPHYKDQAAMYNRGAFRKMKINKAEIIKTSSKLVLQPK